MDGIFINYRGDDSQTAARLIDRELAARFGDDRVFLDCRSIRAGSDFVEELLLGLRACSVLLVVIGPRWLTITTKAGRRRIDDPKDWLHREIVEAFKHRLRVIPVLTDGAALPAEADLPEDIAGLSRRQYVPLRRRYTTVDLDFLVKQITEADPKLAEAATRHRPNAEPVPCQLPAAVAYFAGRMGELAKLTGLLRGRATTGGTVVISAIGGTAGVGKTALAVHWAHQVANRFPDGQLYVNLRGFDPSSSVMQPADALRRFLDALHVPPERIPAELDHLAARYRSQLAGKRMLVVLDNARDAAQVRPLLPGAPTCLVLVTSRNQLTSLIAADGAHPITVDLLTDEEARQLLVRRLDADRVAADPAAVADIITRCAHLPLALALVAARAATHPHSGLRQLADELHDTQHRWQTLTGDDPTTDVRAVFSWSYQALNPPAARLFRLLGLHPGPDLAAPAAASLAGVPASTVQPLLGELTRASLLAEPTTLGRYTLHDLLRSYATDLTDSTDPDQQRHAATHRMLDHYLHTAHTADRLLHPARDPLTLTPAQPRVTPYHPADHQQAMNWFTVERPVLLAAIDHAAANGFDTHAWQLPLTMRIFLDRRGHWHDLAIAGRAAVAAAGRLADPSAQVRAHHILAHAYIRLGRFDDAHAQLTCALDLATQISDQTGQAHTHHSLAYLWERQGNNSRALDHARQALDLYRAASHQNGQARALNLVGWYHARLGDHQQALTSCQQALDLHQDLHDLDGQAQTWVSLGFAHHHLRHHTDALDCYRHGLTLYQDLSDRYNEATTLTYLGDTHHSTGNPHAARDAWAACPDHPRRSPPSRRRPDPHQTRGAQHRPRRRGRPTIMVNQLADRDEG
jgi:tetratricopeptide (TPR) repeat protein